MTYRRWDILFLKQEDNDRTGHPAVVLSSDDVMGDDKQHRFNVLTGTKKEPAENARNHQVILGEPDGLTQPTFINCAMVFVVRKAAILRSSGSVTLHRRQQIQRIVRGYLGLG